MRDNASTRRDALVGATLTHVPFDGWSVAALRAGARDLGQEPETVQQEFPRGVADAIRHFSRQADRHMLSRMEGADLEELRIHERVALAVETRLAFLAPHREAVHRGLTWLALPQNAMLGARLLYRTVDDIWYAVGDRSADFSFYTKRGLLAGVVGSTTLFWLDDRSEDAAETSAFLHRRIADVMKIHGVRKRIEGTRSRALGPLGILKDVVEKRYGRRDTGDSRVT
ncbi:MAG: COQ9 family protein [Alphaproteobacteria bacterium]